MKNLLLTLVAVLVLAAPSLAEDERIKVLTSSCETIPARYERTYFPPIYPGRPERWKDMKVEDKKSKCRIVLKNIGAEALDVFVDVSYGNASIFERVKYFPAGETVEIIKTTVMGTLPLYPDVRIHTQKIADTPTN